MTLLLNIGVHPFHPRFGVIPGRPLPVWVGRPLPCVRLPRAGPASALNLLGCYYELQGQHPLAVRSLEAALAECDEEAEAGEGAAERCDNRARESRKTHSLVSALVRTGMTEDDPQRHRANSHAHLANMPV